MIMIKEIVGEKYWWVFNSVFLVIENFLGYFELVVDGV